MTTDGTLLSVATSMGAQVYISNLQAVVIYTYRGMLRQP